MVNEKIQIDGKFYPLIDALENIPIVDSFVKENKIGRGHGEARLYVGQQRFREFKDFFNNFASNGFFIKTNLQTYLTDAKFEYENQEQGYCKDISQDWQIYLNDLSILSDKEYFEIENATGTQDHSRFYIRATEVREGIWDYFRKISLPVISRLSIFRVKDFNNEEAFFFMISLDYCYDPYHHKVIIKKEEEKIESIKTNLKPTEKEQIIKARLGQGKFRQDLLEESCECVITRVNDERILVASHIKPWSVSTNEERLSHYNGLIFTPTYDKLFDQGFISFDENGQVLISPYISPLNIKKLNLSSNKTFEIPSMTKRKTFLEYHRENIFKK